MAHQKVSKTICFLVLVTASMSALIYVVGRYNCKVTLSSLLQRFDEVKTLSIILIVYLHRTLL